VPSRSHRRWWVTASTLNVLNVVAGIWLVTHTPPHRTHTCDTLNEMIGYTERRTAVMNDEVVFPNQGPPPIDKDLPDWANGMRQYAQQLKQLDPPLAVKPMELDNLANDAQEIVYLLQYIETATPPFTGKGPPPLWMTRYNEVAYEIEMTIQLLQSASSVCAAKPQHPETSATTATSTPKTLPAQDITDKLLKPSELARIVGDPEMTDVYHLQHLDVPTQGFDPLDCAARAAVGNTFPYYGPSRVATAGDVNLNPDRGLQGPRIYQLITAWQDNEQPKKVLSQSAFEWEHYCQQPYTMTIDNSTIAVANLGPVKREPPDAPTRIIAWDQTDDRKQICFHVMASRANILAEDIACGYSDTDADIRGIARQADEIADGMLNNVSR